MNGEAKQVESVPAVSKSDIDYLHRRIDDQNDRIDELTDKIKLLARILVDKNIVGEEIAKSVEESEGPDNLDLMAWLIEETFGVEEAKKFWIAGAIKHKGALRASLGIKEDEVIPKSVLQQIINTETGKTITFRGKTITVTTQLKRRALLAVRLGKMPKRGK